LITRPSAALFLNHMFALSLCRCVVLVKVCYACEVFDNAAFGRVIFKSTFLLSWCSCVVIVNVCCAGCWLLAAGCWLLAACCRLLAAGCCSKWSSFRFPFSSNKCPMGFPLDFFSISLNRVRTSRRSTDPPPPISLHKHAAGCWLLFQMEFF
jgi:hypothetical protein